MQNLRKYPLYRIWDALVHIAATGLFLVSAWNGIVVQNYLKGTFFMAFVIAIEQTFDKEK